MGEMVRMKERMRAIEKKRGEIEGIIEVIIEAIVHLKLKK